VLDLFGIDTIELGRGFALEDADWADWPLPDGTPAQMPAWALPEREERQWVYRSRSGNVIAKMPDGALYFEQCCWPFLDSDDLDRIDEAAEETMWSAIASPPGPLIAGPDGDRVFVEGARRLRERTDRAIIGLFGGNLFEFGQWCYRMDRFLMLLAAEPRRAQQFLDRLVERYLTRLEHYLGLIGPYIDVICFGDDLGMQNGPQISTAMYRELFKPRHARMWRRAKELADVKVMLHCCGGVRPLLADLIDAGLDAINPVQITCRGMDAQSLKDEFGGKITFWGGGCDTRFVLGSASPDEVAEHVRRQIAILNPGGGFVFQQVHNVLANVPPENVVAMFTKGVGAK
jgi:uroporphyrinogen decarboxylase